MKIGTKSLLFGYHQFLIHPIVLFFSWWRLFGFPWDPRLWVAFLVHDWGYWGKLNMDGPEGEKHPERGAFIMWLLFDYLFRPFRKNTGTKWRDFTLYHSRFYAKKAGKPISRLCLADKYSIIATPWYLFVLMTWATGELAEYRKGQNGRTQAGDKSHKQWHGEMQACLVELITKELPSFQNSFEWVYGTTHGESGEWRSRRHRWSRRIEFVLWEKGQTQGDYLYEQDFWYPLHEDHWPTFKPYKP